MFARLVELTIKPNTKPELIQVLRSEVLPIGKKCNGFLEMIPLDAEAEPTKFYVMSLWREKRDAERFDREQFPQVQSLYARFLTAPVAVKLCHVDEAVTMRKFAAAAA